MRAVVLALAAVLALLSAPAQAGTKFTDEQPCATEPEVMHMPQTTQQAAERYIDTKGWTVYNDGLYKIKRYDYCLREGGWLAVSYDLTKRGWRYRASVLIYMCKHSDGDGPYVACDPHSPEVSYVEAAVLRGHGGQG